MGSEQKAVFENFDFSSQTYHICFQDSTNSNDPASLPCYPAWNLAEKDDPHRQGMSETGIGKGYECSHARYQSTLVRKEL